ncbi:MAG: DMT family transporter [Pseudomonadota bacterium]
MSERQHRPTLGIFWMVVTGLCFVAVTALVKVMGPRIPAAEAAFLRYALGLVFLIPAAGALRRYRFDSGTLKLFGIRSACHTLGVILWFYAMTQIPLSEVTAMNYLNPVYVTLAAALFLGERLAMRRLLAVLAALIGALIILRPGFRELNSGHFAMLFTAAVFAGSYLSAKMLSERAPPSVVVGMLSITVTICLAPFAYAVWITPTPLELALLFGVACFATAGHYTMTLAFSMAPLTVTQPVTFLQLVWAVSLGYFAFGEAVDIWVILGGAIILAAVSFITWREAVLKRQVTPTTHQTKG